MPKVTLFYHLSKADATSKKSWLKGKHNTEYPGNELAIFKNVADTEQIVKVCANPQADPGGVTLLGKYTPEEVAPILQSAPWRRLTPAA
jgi:hypothetical protein